MAVIPLNINDPVQIGMAGDPNAPMVFLNRDVNNSVLIGTGKGTMFPSNPDTYTLDPFGYCVWDGKQDMWAVALTGNPTLQTMPGISNWGAPTPITQPQDINISTVQESLSGTDVEIFGVDFNIVLKYAWIDFSVATTPSFTTATQGHRAKIYNAASGQILLNSSIAVTAASQDLTKFIFVPLFDLPINPAPFTITQIRFNVDAAQTGVYKEANAGVVWATAA